jgi:membrane-associated protease RseP (regulator of RpoE activity)
MKTILAIMLAVTLLLIGCSRAAETPELTKPETVVQSFKEALSRGEVDTCLSLASDDAVFRTDPLGFTFEGKEQIRGWLMYLVAWNFDWSTTSPYSVDGTRVTFSADMRSDHYRLLGMEIMRARIEFLVNDGKISSFLITENDEDVAKLDELTKGDIGVRFEWTAGDRPEKGIRVLEVIENSPAQKAGIKVGDLIVAVDGVSCSQMTRPLEVQLRIMGPVGIKVLLTILREGMANPIDIEVIRADLNKPQ